jgi:hypothetical protein
MNFVRLLAWITASLLICPMFLGHTIIDSGQTDQGIEPLSMSECALQWSPSGKWLVTCTRDSVFAYPGLGSISISPTHSVQYVRWNRAETRCILGDKDTAVIMDCSKPSVHRTMTALSAWWKGDSIEWMSGSWLLKNIVIHQGIREYRIKPQLNITATSDDGKFCLAWEYHHSKDKEPIGNLCIYAHVGGGNLRRIRYALKDRPLSEDFAGDFLTCESQSSSFYFGISTVTFSDKSYVLPYRLNKSMGSASRLWTSPDLRTTPPCSSVSGNLIGIRTDPYASPDKRPVEVFEAGQQKCRVSRVHNRVLGIASSKHSTKTAYLIRSVGGADLMVLENGVLKYFGEIYNAASKDHRARASH